MKKIIILLLTIILFTLFFTPKVWHSPEQLAYGDTAIAVNKGNEQLLMAMGEIILEPKISYPMVTLLFFSGIKDGIYKNIIFENRYLLIINGLKTTIIISVLACLFGTLLGGLICLMRMSKQKVLIILARIYISILRGMPVLVLLMLIFYVVFASVNISAVLVSIIAFGMNFAAYVSEMFRTSIEGIDKGQYEAGIAGGFNKFQTFLYIIMPQAIQQVLPVYKGEFISMVKMTSVVGYIAVQDLTKASDIIRSRTYDAFFPLVMVAILYFVVSWLLTLSLDYISLQTDPKSKRRKVSKSDKSYPSFKKVWRA
ncbi:amino acid ABC transporter permease [Candidatus Contubernalis alkaliaceticus]|uniref:amino acid ABC transporter permease n=1 Tax=Candidatus Contubernalis alkaliaceticus TaxID=338645 RepID=UPI001F4C2FEC|nr:amino acid ABC transporter permease [Candidatus Contubernalis alkalaceticus]UNC92454.1 amino acid ABC transporter permease [Candidatus Contubernalis alkalaceticus]